MVKILITGASGLVGSRFVELHKDKSELILPDEHELDISSPDMIKSYFSRNNFDSLIHFAAYTDVGKAEEERDDQNAKCWQINVEGTKNLVSSLKDGVHFIQISTDMVFSGSPDDPGPYSEDHKPEPDSSKVTWYGYTKGVAEEEVLKKLGQKATIFRLIYPVRASFPGKLDYIRKPLKLFDEGKLYPMFTDQQVSISFIDEIAEALELILQNKKFGTFHASSVDTASPYELYTYLIERARGVKNAVKSSTLQEFLKKVDNPVRYPMYGGLKVEKTEKELGIQFSTWQEIIDHLVNQGISI